MKQYYYLIGEKVCGPYSVDDLMTLKERHVITPQTRLCLEGESQWKAASSILPRIRVPLPVAPVKVSAPSGNAMPVPRPALLPIALPVHVCRVLAALSALAALILLIASMRSNGGIEALPYNMSLIVCVTDALLFWLLGCGIHYAHHASLRTREILAAIKNDVP